LRTWAVILGEEQVAKRGSRISHILKPLSRIPSGPASERRGSSNGEIIIGVHDGSLVKSHFTDWRFATTIPGFSANYYEIWSLTDVKQRRFCLEKAYLTIYKDDQEYICLHCDPNRTNVEETEKIIYQKGPHLHIKCADKPIPKAHLALGGVHTEKTISDAESLTNAIKWSIQMIKDEVLDRIASTS